MVAEHGSDIISHDQLVLPENLVTAEVTVMENLNLMTIYEGDIEEFVDVISDNVRINGELLSAGSKIEFGNSCSLVGVSHQQIDDVKLLSKFLLHMQAENNIKIKILWDTEDEDSILEFYFEDNGEGPFDEGPNVDPTFNSHWDEFLVDLGIKTDPYEDGHGGE